MRDCRLVSRNFGIENSHTLEVALLRVPIKA